MGARCSWQNSRNGRRHNLLIVGNEPRLPLSVESGLKPFTDARSRFFKVQESAGDHPITESQIIAERMENRFGQLIMLAIRAIDTKRKTRAVALRVVDDRVDEVVGRSKPQPVGRFKKRKVLE